MMDFFGIGPALCAFVGMYQQAARRSGRTTRLLDSVKAGDRVIFDDIKRLNEFKGLLAERAREAREADPTHGVALCVLEPRWYPHRALDMGTSQGRTIFDHVWLERHYETRLREIGEDIAKAEKALSGYGEDHRKTRRQAEEVARNGGMDFHD